MKQKLIITITLLIAAFTYVKADEVTFTADAPNAVVMDETFRLSYTVNTHNTKNFRVGNITDFDIL